MSGVFEQALKLLAESGSVYLVGGAVRDQLLGLPSKDVDAVVSLPLPEVEAKLRAHGFNPHVIGARKQTVTLFSGGARLDIAEFTDLRKDALRRDFTINAIFRNFSTGELYDPLKGLSDLGAKRLRACGNPQERFQEDPVRLLRLIRFAVKYDLSMDPETWAAAQADIALLGQAAKERVTEELGRILCLDDVEKAMRLLDDLGYFQHYVPELARLKGLAQNRYHTKDVWEHTLAVMKNTPPTLMLRLAALFHDIGKWEVASRECLVYGKLVLNESYYFVAGFKVVGNALEKWHDRFVQIRGARLDHYPEIIQVKSIRPVEREGEGFEWVPEGKRHFLGHEKESGRLLRQILPRYTWNMVLSVPAGDPERELIKLVENHMRGTLTFMPELRGEKDPNASAEKMRRFVWDVGWDGRVFSVQRVNDLLALWEADYYGGKQREAGDNERFALVRTGIAKAVLAVEQKLKSLNWDAFSAFASRKNIRGKVYGRFKEYIRFKAIVQDRDPSDIEFLEKEYQNYGRSQSGHH